MSYEALRNLVFASVSDQDLNLLVQEHPEFTALNPSSVQGPASEVLYPRCESADSASSEDRLANTKYNVPVGINLCGFHSLFF